MFFRSRAVSGAAREAYLRLFGNESIANRPLLLFAILPPFRREPGGDRTRGKVS